MLRSKPARRVRPFSQGRNVCAVIARAKRTRLLCQTAAARRPRATRRLAIWRNWLKSQAIRNPYERNEQQRQVDGRSAAEADPSSEAPGRAGHGAPELFAWAQQGGCGREGEATRSRARRDCAARGRDTSRRAREADSY